MGFAVGALLAAAGCAGFGVGGRLLFGVVGRFRGGDILGGGNWLLVGGAIGVVGGPVVGITLFDSDGGLFCDGIALFGSVGGLLGFAVGALLAASGCAGFGGRSAVVGGGLPVVGGLFGGGIGLFSVGDILGSVGLLTGGAARVGGGRLGVPICLDVGGGDVVGADVVCAAQEFAGGPDALGCGEAFGGLAFALTVELGVGVLGAFGCRLGGFVFHRIYEKAHGVRAVVGVFAHYLGEI